MSAYAKFDSNSESFTVERSRGNEFFIFVKTLTGKTLTLNVTRGDTVDDVKLKLQDKLATPAAQQKLVYRGKLLVNGSLSLEDADIGNEAMIHLIIDRNAAGAPAPAPPKQDKPLEIFVKTLTGKTIPVTIQSSYTIMNLKYMLSDKLSIPVESQKIVFKGQVLQDHHTISQCEVTNEAMVHLLIQNSMPAAPVAPEVPPPPPPVQRYELEQESAISRIKLLIHVTFYRVFSQVNQKLLSPALRTLDEILNFIWNVSRQIGRFVRNSWELVSRIVRNVSTLLNNYVIRPIDRTLRACTRAVRSVFRFVQNLVTRVWNFLDGSILSPILRISKRLYNFLKTGFSNTFRTLSRALQTLGRWFSNTANFVQRYLIKPPARFVRGAIRASTTFIKDSTIAVYEHGVVPFFATIDDFAREMLDGLFELAVQSWQFGKRYVWRPIRATGEWTQRALSTVYTKGVKPLCTFIVTSVETNVLDTCTMIGDMFRWFFPRVKRLVVRVFQAISDVVSRVGNAIESAARKIGSWIEELIKFCHRQVSAFVRFLDWIRLKVQNFITSLGRGVWNAIEKVWKFLSRCVTNTMDWISKHILSPITRALCRSVTWSKNKLIQAAKWSKDKFVWLCKKSWQALKTICSWVNSWLIKPVVRALTWTKNKTVQIVTWTKDKVFAMIKSLYRNANWAIRRFASLLNSWLIQPTIRGLTWSKNKTVQVVRWSGNKVKSVVQTSWTGVKNSWRFVYDHGLVPCYNGVKAIGSFTKRMLTSTWRLLISRPLQFAWDEFKWLCSWINTNILRPIFHYDFVNLVSRWIGTPIANLFRFFKRLLQPLFTGLRSVLNRFVSSLRWVSTQLGNGVRRIVNLFADWPGTLARFIGRVLRALLINPLRNTLSYLHQTRVVQGIIRTIRWVVKGDRRCVMVRGYGVDIRPSVMVLQGDRTLWRLRNGQEYAIWVQNSTGHACDCKLSIDGAEIGVFHLKPYQCYTIERPLSELRRFTFHADGSKSFAGPKSANDPSLGLIKAEFVPPYFAPARSQAVQRVADAAPARSSKRKAKSMFRKESSISPVDVPELPAEQGVAGEANLEVVQDEVFGATSFTGKQSQQEFKRANVAFVPDYNNVVTVTGRLVLAQ